MPTEFNYRVSAWWASGRSGLAKCESCPSALHFSDAVEFGGLESRWTPTQLLLCALASSFTTSFHELARQAKFPYTDLEVAVECRARRARSAGLSLQQIRILPRLTVACETQKEAALELLRRTKDASLISRSMSVEQLLEPRVDVGKASLADWTGEEDLTRMGA